MTLGAHSKIAFSSFAGSKIKKRVAKESLKRQCGAKLAGAEAIVHAFQQAIVQNPDYDASSADAVKALYSLSRDVAMRKLKEAAVDDDDERALVVRSRRCTFLYK